MLITISLCSTELDLSEFIPRELCAINETLEISIWQGKVSLCNKEHRLRRSREMCTVRWEKCLRRMFWSDLCTI